MAVGKGTIRVPVRSTTPNGSAINLWLTSSVTKSQTSAPFQIYNFSKMLPHYICGNRKGALCQKKIVSGYYPSENYTPNLALQSGIGVLKYGTAIFHSSDKGIKSLCKSAMLLILLIVIKIRIRLIICMMKPPLGWTVSRDLFIS